MRTFIKLFFIACFAATVSCSSDDDQPDKLPKAEPIILKSEFNNKLQGGNRFALNLFKATYKNEDTENVFLSPLSVDMALGMTWNGANGETKNQMQSVLGNDGYSPEDINEYAKSLREALLKVDPSTQISIANSIWYKSGFQVEKSFIDINKANYNAEVEGLDFSSADAVTRINNWVANNTKNKITEIIDQIPASAVMYLVNAVYFKGIWVSKFDKNNTVDDYFEAENNQKQQVKMMCQTSDFPYTEDINTRYMEMPYGNEAFSMVIMLPQSGKNINDVINSLTPASWNEAIDRLRSCKVNVKMPRLKIACEYEMSESILPEMGMKLPFMPRVADFSKINPFGDLHISEVKHKTYVEINEEGTEAAAVTSIGMELTSEPTITDYFVNEPFVFAIREKSTGIILFIGKIGVIKQ